MPQLERRIVLHNGPPWGFRLAETRDGLVVSKVMADSVAHKYGLHEGDQVVALEATDVRNMSHSDVLSLIDGISNDLRIHVLRHYSSELKQITLKPVTGSHDPSISVTKVAHGRRRSSLEKEYAQSHPHVVAIANRASWNSAAPSNNQILAADSEEVIVPISPGVSPVSLRKLQSPANDSPTLPPPKGKIYGDSSFYGNSNLYPSVQEQKKMARSVATSLTAPANVSSRGADMFHRRKKRAAKWIAGASHSDDINDCAVADGVHTSTGVRSHRSSDCSMEGYATPPPLVELAVPVMYGADLESLIPDDAPLPEQPPPPNQPASSYPSLVPERHHPFTALPIRAQPAAVCAPKTEKEFLELLRAYPRNKHNVISPAVCFDIASQLHRGQCAGARVFAKRRAKFLRWEDGDEDGSVGGGSEGYRHRSASSENPLRVSLSNHGDFESDKITKSTNSLSPASTSPVNICTAPNAQFQKHKTLSMNKQQNNSKISIKPKISKALRHENGEGNSDRHVTTPNMDKFFEPTETTKWSFATLQPTVNPSLVKLSNANTSAGDNCAISSTNLLLQQPMGSPTANQSTRVNTSDIVTTSGAGSMKKVFVSKARPITLNTATRNV